MSRLLLGIALTMSLGLAAPTPGQEAFLVRAAVADRRLWLLSDAGVLASLSLEGGDLRPSESADPIDDVCVVDGKLYAVAQSANEPHFILQRKTTAGWVARTTIPAISERFAGFNCSDGRFTLLTSKRIVTIDGANRAVVALQKRLSPAGITAVYRTPDALLLALNRGEWGGGLTSIDINTGAATTIEDRANAGLCTGPLNPDCDPVTALTRDPWSPQCVVAAIGMVHFAPHGRIVEVCGNRVRRIFYSAYAWGGPNRTIRGDEPYSTVAFFGLEGMNGAIVAVGIDGVYTIQRDGTSTRTPLPTFKPYGPYRISFQNPQYVLVLTEANQRRSISGAVPMLVPR